MIWLLSEIVIIMSRTSYVSSVGIATDYGLDGSGSNPGVDEIFRPFGPALWPTQGTGPFPGVEAAGAWG